MSSPAIKLADQVGFRCANNLKFFGKKEALFDTELQELDQIEKFYHLAREDLIIENQALLAANLDCIDNFNALKADYDKLRTALVEITIMSVCMMKARSIAKNALEETK